jgi:hypothetical protein
MTTDQCFEGRDHVSDYCDGTRGIIVTEDLAVAGVCLEERCGTFTI